MAKQKTSKLVKAPKPVYETEYREGIKQAQAARQAAQAAAGYNTQKRREAMGAYREAVAPLREKYETARGAEQQKAAEMAAAKAAERQKAQAESQAARQAQFAARQQEQQDRAKQRVDAARAQREAAAAERAKQQAARQQAAEERAKQAEARRQAAAVEREKRRPVRSPGSAPGPVAAPGTAPYDPGFKKKGGVIKKYASGGRVTMGAVKTAKPSMGSASKRADGVAQRGKTRGKLI